MKRFLVPLVLLVLAACAQAPVPGIDAPTNLAPLTFGSSGYDTASALARHSTGVYAVGYTDGNLQGTPKGSYDAFIRKYDTGGAVLWGKQFGTPNYDYAAGVASDGSNNAYVVGETYGSLAGSRGGSDIFLRKYNASGGVVWTKQFGTPDYDSAGDVAVYGSNVYVAGYTPGNLAGSKGSYDAFIRKYSSSGSVLWTRQFGTSAEDLAMDVAVDGSGNLYVVGYTYGSLGGTNGGEADMFIRKYTASGSVSWTKQLHYSLGDYAYGVAVSGSSVYLVGHFYFNAASSTDADVRIVKYSTSGSQLWNTSYGPSTNEYVSDVTADSSGVTFAGSTDGSIGGANQGGSDGFVVKFNGSGSSVWAKQQGTSEHDSTNAVLARSSSEVYAAGNTYGLLGGTNSGGGAAFLRRLSGTNGNTVWTDQ